MAKDRKPIYRAIFRDDPFGWVRYANEKKGFGYVGALHKGAVPEVPHRFANELISARIASFLQLPIPPFGITQFAGQDGVDETKRQLLFSSVDFNFERDTLPDPDWDCCIRELPHLCTGVLLFDILIANSDRKRDNLWCDHPSKPTKMLIYDHDQALLGGEHDGIERLLALRNQLGLCYWSIGGGDHHPFLTRVDSRNEMEDWLARIYSLPDWLLVEVCQEARKYDIGNAEANAIYDFLSHRRRNLESIISSHRGAFASIGDWQFGLFE